jgi:GT2 family glycosyltransferase
MTGHGSVAVSIVSTGERDRIGPCLESLGRQAFDGSLTIVVVVNGEDDGTTAVAKSIFPDARIIQREAPQGFAANHTAALQSVAFDFGLILNPDVVLEQTCIAEFIDAMTRHPRAGIVAPLLSYPSGEPQPSARRFPRIAGTVARRTPLRRMFPDRVAHSRHFLPPPASDRMIDWALGACLFARAEAWRATGGFDPGYAPLYVEDVDLAWRMWRAGWEVWQTPLARADHEHQAATDKVFFDRRTLWHARGMLRFVRKHPRILVSGARPAAERAEQRS